MLPPTWFAILGAVLTLWLLALSLWVYKLASHYSKLVRGNNKENLKDILEKIWTQESALRKDFSGIQTKAEQTELKIQKNLQKVGVVKFNSFGDTGGNQSFAVALLDANDSGVVILSLHGREGTRIYAKTVARGKSPHDLSKEEQQALTQAK